MLSCHHGPGGRAAAVRGVAARRAGARLAVLLAVLCTVLGSGPARAAVGTAGLLPGQTLLAGQSISDGRDILTMQADGNLVLYARSIPVWATTPWAMAARSWSCRPTATWWSPRTAAGCCGPPGPAAIADPCWS